MRKQLWFILSAGLISLFSCQGPDQFIVKEAESFSTKGGWVIDQQSMDRMASSYIMAHGLGNPVADAFDSVDLPENGRWHVYVRTRDWVANWNAPGTPGRFKVFIDGKELKTTFGTEGKDWHWQYGGSFRTGDSRIEIRLRDLTGFNGRVDAICLSNNRQAELPEAHQYLEEFRKKYGSLPSEPIEAGSFDLVVAGGGLAGICAAVSAARLGLKVALIQNRPVLGGNNSSEIRVHLMGNTDQNRYPEIGNIVREMDLPDPGNAGPAEAYGDMLKEMIVRSEPNISLFLNLHVIDAEVIDLTISSIVARNIETGVDYRFHGSYFADCTGDGTLGYLSGTDFKTGRESYNETGESMAPQKRDDLSMGSSNLWYSEIKSKESSFPELPWALQFTEDYHLDEERADWRWEGGFGKDIIMDAEEIRDYNLRAIFGNWSYLKNHKKEKYAYHELTWVSYISGKRESRRLMGDVILSQYDIENRTEFNDACVTATWGIDLHFPDSLNSLYFPGEEFYSWYNHPHHPPYEIPYRCLYARNCNNLFMAGRNISVTRVALGTIRVMRTTGMMGEVVGMAAAVAKKHNSSPREVYKNHLDELIELFKTGVGKGVKPILPS